MAIKTERERVIDDDDDDDNNNIIIKRLLSSCQSHLAAQHTNDVLSQEGLDV